MNAAIEQNKSPLVSVVMAVFNAEAHLEDAVESILQQDWPRMELIAVDDGSTDSSLQILKRYEIGDQRVRIFQQSNHGPAAARNLGASYAKGKYIAVMDADDIAERLRLSAQVEFLENHPACVAVGGYLQFIDPRGATISVETDRPTTHEKIMDLLLTGLGGIPNPAAMIRAEAFHKVGGYATEYQAAEDLDLWLRLVDHGTLANLPAVLLRYRLHESSLSFRNVKLQNELCRKAVHSYFRRQGDELPAGHEFNLPEPFSPSRQRMNWAWMAVRGNRPDAACHYAWEAVMMEPGNLRLWYQWLRIRLGLTEPLFRSGTK